MNQGPVLNSDELNIKLVNRTQLSSFIYSSTAHFCFSVSTQSTTESLIHIFLAPEPFWTLSDTCLWPCSLVDLVNGCRLRGLLNSKIKPEERHQRGEALQQDKIQAHFNNSEPRRMWQEIKQQHLSNHHSWLIFPRWAAFLCTVKWHQPPPQQADRAGGPTKYPEKSQQTH